MKLDLFLRCTAEKWGTVALNWDERLRVIIRKSFYSEDNYKLHIGIGCPENLFPWQCLKTWWEGCTNETPFHLSDSGTLVEIQVEWVDVLEPLYKYLLRRIWNLLIKKTVATSSNSVSVHFDPFLLPYKGKSCSLSCNLKRKCWKEKWLLSLTALSKCQGGKPAQGQC